MRIWKYKKPKDIWIRVMVVAVILIAIIVKQNLWPTVFIILVIGVVISIIIHCFQTLYRRKFLSFSNIDNMDGKTFEYFIASLLEDKGFRAVTVTKASGDFGCDITANYMGQQYIFQCKRYDKNLGIKPIQEIHTARTYYPADVAVVVTNSYFTPAAEELSYNTGVLLWDRDMLEKLSKSKNIQMLM